MGVVGVDSLALRLTPRYQNVLPNVRIELTLYFAFYPIVQSKESPFAHHKTLEILQ